jgi:putative radical SAM enzyme (TIGR03279 family)
MSSPRVVAVAPGSPAEVAGIVPGDRIEVVNGQVPRDVIQWQLLTDEAEIELEVVRGGLHLTLEVAKRAGQPLGIEVHSALFDQVRTCDNHCEFCFIYQLPPGLRRSLYVKDDDYRLSFLYGNYTTLTRFTEADLERVITEKLSPLNVSIHTTDPELRSRMLRNRRGATSLRWLRALLDAGITVHGQVVVCPGVNDGDELSRTFAGVLDRYPELASLCIVPLGVSRWSTEPALRSHTADEARAVVDTVERWQAVFLGVLGRRVAFLADEYYLLADRPFPEADAYEGFPMHEDGIGMARTFELEMHGLVDEATGVAPGFFAWVDGAPAEGYRAPRVVPPPASPTGLMIGGPHTVPESSISSGKVTLLPRRDAPIAILTGEYGARILTPLVDELGRADVRVVPVRNEFFGGNVGVAGLLVGSDLARVLADEPHGHRYLLPDVCLSEGKFLDGSTPADLPRPVEVIATDGVALRSALGVPVGAPA